MDIVIICLCGLVVLLLLVTIFLLIKILKIKQNGNLDITPLSKLVSDNIKNQNELFLISVNNKIDLLEKVLKENLDSNNSFQNKINLEFEKIINKLDDNNQKSLIHIKEQINDFSKIIKESINEIYQSVKDNLETLRNENKEKLNQIQGVVDEKLEKVFVDKLTTSFNNVIEQIGGVNKAIGEIKGLASDVGSLKNVLTNVKTKGIIGEIILSSLIKEILANNQYEENFSPKNNLDRVEFAIKMPSNDDKNEFVYLPVDSKFPTETYQRLLLSYEQGNKEEIDRDRKELANVIKKFAKDISVKYINEPITTSFAIMFLPTEGLYAEVINLNIIEEIQNKYRVNIAGPSTFASLLNALQMGFKSYVIQKRSSDVFKLLVSVKQEFAKFADALSSVQKKIAATQDDLETLVGTRTRKMQIQLKNIIEDDLIE